MKTLFLLATVTCYDQDNPRNPEISAVMSKTSPIGKTVTVLLKDYDPDEDSKWLCWAYGMVYEEINNY